MAGPGSGKTTVLVERYAWLIAEKQLKPHQILAITFTEKAAHEIKQRLAARFRHDPAVKHEIERAPVATIHGFCARLLRRFAIAAGLDPQFEILDENRQRTELAAAIRETLDRMADERQTELRRLLTGWKADDPEQALTELYDAWRSSGGTAAALKKTARRGEPSRMTLISAGEAVLAAAPLRLTPALAERMRFHREWLAALAARPEDTAPFDLFEQYEFSLAGQRDERLKGRVHVFKEALKEYEAALLEKHFAPARKLLVEAFLAAAELYQKKKQARAALDFTDLETETICLLERDRQVQRRVQAEFSAVLMDELQDTNPQQWRLIDLVRAPNAFFAVGDINQSIFGFRHAEPRVFAEYRDQLQQRGKAIDYLRGNNRSRHEILRAVERIVHGVAGIEPPEFEPRLHFTPTGTAPVEYLQIEADDRAKAEQLEAQWIARRIRERELDGARLRDIAVLVRNTGGLDLLEQALRDYQIPFVMNRGRQFFEEQEVRDLVHWLRVVDNPRDELALLAVLRSPLFGTDDDEIYAVNSGGGKLRTLVDDRLEPYRRMRDHWPPDRLVTGILDESGYLGTLTPRARGNVDKLLGMLRDWHHSEARPLAGVIHALDQLRMLGMEPNAPEQQAVDAVEVLTIHGAKGLEWPIVFVASLHRGTPSTPPPVSFSPAQGLGVTWRHPITFASVNDLLHNANLDERKAREAEEAHRLLYVALTRAAEQLVVTSAGRGRSDWPMLVEREIVPEVLTAAPPRFDLPERALASGAGDPGLTWVAALQPQTYDSNVSISRLLAFRRCPRQAWLQSLLPVLPADEEAASPASFGRTVHELLAGLQPMADAQALALAERFHESPLGERAARATRIEHEYDFMVEVEGVVLRGQIDLWFEESGELVVVDYKTDAHATEERLQEYSLQMQFYALAVERALRRPDRCVLVFLRAGREVEVAPDAGGCAELVRAWKGRATEMRAGPHCERCDFYQKECPSPWVAAEVAVRPD